MTTTRISTHVRFTDVQARGVEVRIREDYVVLEITAGDCEHTYYFETLQEVKELFQMMNNLKRNAIIMKISDLYDDGQNE